jgi:CheY-like chemotaxis protein
LTVANLQSLDTAAPHDASASASAAAAAAVARARILVVDDDVAIGRSLHRLLCHEHDVWVESDARAALARVTAGETFDVIFCDLIMPHMTGMDFFAALQKSHAAAARRVVFLTAGTCSRGPREFLASVANASVSKPFSIATIRSIARRHARPAPP